jgi:hypothetical protein
LEEYKRRWQILVSSQGVVQGFRAKYYTALQAKAQIIILESETTMGETVGRFAKKPFKTLNQWWNI